MGRAYGKKRGFKWKAIMERKRGIAGIWKNKGAWRKALMGRNRGRRRIEKN